MSQTSKFQGVQTKIATTATEIIGSYRGTEVCVKQLSSGKVKLLNNGWFTATTKLRMNQFSNQFCSERFQVSQVKGEWFVRVDGQTIPYVEGMTI